MESEHKSLLLLAILFSFLALPSASAFHTTTRDPPGTMYGLNISNFKACIVSNEPPSSGLSYNPNCVFEKRVWAELKNPENKKPGYATLLVFAQGPYDNPAGWSGSILDTGTDSATIGGRGDDKIPLLCETGGIYSLNIQQDDTGLLQLAVIKEGKLLDSGQTAQQYGIVSLAGQCG
jgi:hypothetical protein